MVVLTQTSTTSLKYIDNTLTCQCIDWLDIATISTIQVHSLFLSVTCLLLFGADHRAQQLVQLPINVVHFIIYKTSILMDKSRVWEHNAKMST